MNRPIRMQIGGWAALLAAVAIPLQIAMLFIATGPVEDRLASPQFVLAAALRLIGLLIASIGLHPWLLQIDRRLASAALIAAAVGAAVGLIDDGTVIAGRRPSDLDVVVIVVVNGAIGGWFILAGSALGRAGEDIRRIGWLGQLGGAGLVLAGLSYLIPIALPSQAGGGPSLFQYAQILSVFAVAFLVRVWRFAAFGRLPGPGLI